MDPLLRGHPKLLDALEPNLGIAQGQPARDFVVLWHLERGLELLALFLEGDARHAENPFGCGGQEHVLDAAPDRSEGVEVREGLRPEERPGVVKAGHDQATGIQDHLVLLGDGVEIHGSLHRVGQSPAVLDNLQRAGLTLRGIDEAEQLGAPPSPGRG